MVSKIITFIVIAIGIVSGIMQITFQLEKPLIGIIILVATILFAGLAATYNHWRPVQLLSTRKGIHRATKELIEKSKDVQFCGKLDNALLNMLIGTFNKRNKRGEAGHSSFSLKILNCDPDFYVSFDQSIKEQILDMDAKYPDDVFSHKFQLYRQCVSFLLGKSDGKQNIILFFPSTGNDYNGVYIRRGLSLSTENAVVIEACPTINMPNQLTNIRSVAEKTLEFWTPLQNGWFQPVFPPDDVVKIREIWRDKILEWFNSTAKDLISSGGELKVTWKIVKRSKEDAKKFAKWLETLKKRTLPSIGSVRVTRYMLVSASQYKNDVEYRNLMDGIVSECLPAPLPRPDNDPYRVYFVNSDSLPDNLNDDFALFVLPSGEKIAQDSLRDEKEGVEVLRVLFSRDFQFIKAVEHKLVELEHYNPRTTLKELTT